MPWKAKGKEIIRKTDGKVVGHSKSHAMAEKAVRAKYANTNPRDAAMKEYNRRKMKTDTSSSGGECCPGGV